MTFWNLLNFLKKCSVKSIVLILIILLTESSVIASSLSSSVLLAIINSLRLLTNWSFFVLTKNFSTIGIGAGQPSRLDSCKISTQKAKKYQPEKLKNAIAASDAFFPLCRWHKIFN